MPLFSMYSRRWVILWPNSGEGKLLRSISVRSKIECVSACQLGVVAEYVEPVGGAFTSTPFEARSE
jgi:hypothetical protein